jgi:nucleotide-binding universal stress UspA family protein
MTFREGLLIAGVQDNRGGRRALAWAWEEALLRGCTLELLDVVADDDARAEAEAGLLRMVQAARAEHAGAPVVAVQVVTGDPVEVLVARSSEAALLVVGSHGVSDMLHAVAPAVSDALTRTADCPVVVVPSATPAPPQPARSPARTSD